MIIDTSVLVAILRAEPDATGFLEVIRATLPRRISAGTYVELGVVIDGPGDPIAGRRLDDFLRRMSIVSEPVTEAQARIAREAYRDFGKGSGHPAGLNFGDCLAYALARELNEPLVFKGDDSRHTDIPFGGRPADRPSGAGSASCWPATGQALRRSLGRVRSPS
jgi:ribonuclease VapC